VGSKTLLQKYPVFFNWECQLTQVVLYNGCKMVVVSGIIHYIFALWFLSFSSFFFFFLFLLSFSSFFFFFFFLLPHHTVVWRGT